MLFVFPILVAVCLTVLASYRRHNFVLWMAVVWSWSRLLRDDGSALLSFVGTGLSKLVGA